MTVKASSSVSSKKQPISATKSWNKVRRTCIERLRRNLYTTPEKPSSRRCESLGTADSNLRHKVEDELRRFGVVVESPCSADDANTIGSLSEDTFHSYDCRSGPIFPTADHYITEEELFDLLQDLENEMEEEKLKAFEDMRDCEAEYLSHQIADFEQWEEAKIDNHGTSLVRGLLCPICQEVDVVRIPGGVVCPNHMDGTCAMELEDMKGLQFDELKDRLGEAFTTHSCFCDDRLTFVKNQSSLVGYCVTCLAEYVIL